MLADPCRGKALPAALALSRFGLVAGPASTLRSLRSLLMRGVRYVAKASRYKMDFPSVVTAEWPNFATRLAFQRYAGPRLNAVVSGRILAWGTPHSHCGGLVGGRKQFSFACSQPCFGSFRLFKQATQRLGSRHASTSRDA